MELVEIGYFSKTHGVKGQLLLKPYRDVDLAEIKAIFVDIRGSKAPYFVSGLDEAAHGYLISLEEIDTVEKARLLLNKQVFTQASLLPEEEADDDLAGYIVTDSTLGLLGTIDYISHNGAQDLMHIRYRDREIILPFVDDFIVAIDDEKRTLTYNAPEGLIDVYFE